MRLNVPAIFLIKQYHCHLYTGKKCRTHAGSVRRAHMGYLLHISLLQRRIIQSYHNINNVQVHLLVPEMERCHVNVVFITDRWYVYDADTTRHSTISAPRSHSQGFHLSLPGLSLRQQFSPTSRATPCDEIKVLKNGRDLV